MNSYLPFLIVAASAGTAFAKIDPLVLVAGNTWAYHQKIETGPTVLRTVFDGVTRVRIDSVRSHSDSLLFWTSWKDSSADPAAEYEYTIAYAVVNGIVHEISSGGTRKYPQNAQPLFMLGSELSGSLAYVYFDMRIRFLSKWESHPSTYGTTVYGAYLQGTGLISYDESTFGPLAREKWSLNLLEYNGTVFDSTKMEYLGPVPLTAEKNRRVQSAKAKSPISWKGNVHGITGRRLY